MANLSLLARQLDISRPTARKYRAEGCPIDDLDAARAWIAARKASDGRGGRTEAQPPAEAFLDLKQRVLRATAEKTEAEAQIKALEAATARQNLVPIDDARALIAEVLGALRPLLDQLPVTVGPRANPADPQLGEQAIREGLDGVFRAMERARDAQPRASEVTVSASNVA